VPSVGDGEEEAPPCAVGAGHSQWGRAAATRSAEATSQIRPTSRWVAAVQGRGTRRRRTRLAPDPADDEEAAVLVGVRRRRPPNDCVWCSQATGRSPSDLEEERVGAVLLRLGEKSAVLSSKRRPGARAVVGGGPSRARCTRRRKPRWGKRFCGRADRDDKGENLRAISVRGLPATGSPPLDLEKEGGMSHPTFRRKPSANLYACQDQVSRI
jgi:hypothetical protein